MKIVTSCALVALMMTAACEQTKTTLETSADAAAPEREATTPVANPTRNAYFGDLHIHTKNSFDAYIFGTRTTPDDAYRFAKGETIDHNAGYDIQLTGPPLDFLAVTDHGEYLGIIPAMADPDHPLSQTDVARMGFGDDPDAARAAFLRVGISNVIGEPIEEIYDRELMDSVWAETVSAAERHNDPGNFTTFSAYEFTAMRLISLEEGAQAGANLHRNVIFRGDAPDRLFTTLDSTNPEDLWSWMDTEREAGRDVLSIPHNSNASNGEMFSLLTYEGETLTADYATARMRNEPLVEISQIKGTSETHPDLSPNDEWAGFEQYEYFIGSNLKATVNEGDFVRKALARGLGLQDSEGFNPYKFGMVAASDTHVSAGTFDEETHFGKFATDGSSPAARQSVPPEGAATWDGTAAERGDVVNFAQFSASGLAGVWADANTRDAIFEGMSRKETFGTSGTRIRTRMFASFAYDDEMLNDPNLIEKAYELGVPIGGDLVGVGGEPSFLAWAMRDPISAPLQRLQIVKVWSEDGENRETVHDVACPGDAVPDPDTRRCPDNGASVDLATCATTAGTASDELITLWRDPDFDAAQRAAYYVRVLENPTCRWSTWDAVRNGTPPSPALPATLQERAWTSPIWYAPE